MTIEEDVMLNLFQHLFLRFRNEFGMTGGVKCHAEFISASVFGIPKQVRDDGNGFGMTEEK